MFPLHGITNSKNSSASDPKLISEGCLQDIHWSMGGLGYFATYSLGNINSAQLFEAAMKDEPHLLCFLERRLPPSPRLDAKEHPPARLPLSFLKI